MQAVDPVLLYTYLIYHSSNPRRHQYIWSLFLSCFVIFLNVGHNSKITHIYSHTQFLIQTHPQNIVQWCSKWNKWMNFCLFKTYQGNLREMEVRRIENIWRYARYLIEFDWIDFNKRKSISLKILIKQYNNITITQSIYSKFSEYPFKRKHVNIPKSAAIKIFPL